ncbi:MAG TPA: SAM-dependent methyltransferase [Blastocatellia bacterium]|nr:SAM-dependent methyltransferase [Blastocatellia bacterium]
MPKTNSPTKKRKKLFDIALTGIGIGGFEQVTLDTVEAFKRARIIFHLTSHHQKLKRYCKQVVNLEKKYWTGEEDNEVYGRLANLFLDEAKNGPGVVAVGDGHPAFYDDVTWDVYRRGKKLGLDVRILPAISCLDSMAANCDLEVNSSGLQIVEAATILEADQKINPYLDTLIMQIGWFDTLLLSEISHSKKERFEPVINYLTKFYPETHKVRILRAPYDKSESPTMITTSIRSMGNHHKNILTSSCLFIPALEDPSGSD